MLADAPGRRTQREELKIRVSPVRFRPWPLTANTVEQKRREKASSSFDRLCSTQLVQSPVPQSDHLIERGLAVPACLHALDEPPGHTVVAGPAKLLQGQLLVARCLE